MIDIHGYDGNHINGIKDLTDKGIVVRPLFLYWALLARWIDYNMVKQKISNKIFSMNKTCSVNNEWKKLSIKN